MPTHFLSTADYRGLHCSKRSFTHLHTGLTRPASMWKEQKLDSTLRKRNFRLTRVHLSTRSALELGLKIKTRFLSPTKPLTPCSHWSLVTFSTPHLLVGIRKGPLEPHCNTQGFNPVCFPILVRIGILFNDFSPCTQCGSWIAFGAGPSGCQLFAPPTILHAMGYSVVKWENMNSLIICRLFSGGSRGGARGAHSHFLRPPFPHLKIWIRHCC